MCGVATYQDLVDPRVHEPDPTPAELWEECPHGGACRRLRARLIGWDYDDENTFYWEDSLAEDLGCGECGEREEP